jgi:hypothetical protein
MISTIVPSFATPRRFLPAEPRLLVRFRCRPYGRAVIRPSGRIVAAASLTFRNFGFGGIRGATRATSGQRRVEAVRSPLITRRSAGPMRSATCRGGGWRSSQALLTRPRAPNPRSRWHPRDTRPARACLASYDRGPQLFTALPNTSRIQSRRVHDDFASARRPTTSPLAGPRSSFRFTIRWALPSRPIWMRDSWP